MRRFGQVIVLVGLLTGSVRATEHEVSSAEEIVRMTDRLVPGDVVVLRDGEWTDQAVVFRGKGTGEKPITFRARTPGKVVLNGKASVVMDGEHLVVSGLFLKGAEGTGDAIEIKGKKNRLTETAVVECGHKFFVHVRGSENRMDRCYLAGKKSDHPTMQVEAEGQPNRHRIELNHFGHRPPLGKNGGETIRVGYSGQSMSSSGTIVERNLFERCDGEIEIISSKSCDNVYRFNTFLDCAGMLTLRHGNRCLIEGNFFIGKGKRGSGGVRVIGEDHVVINNYIEGVTQGGFWITSGIADSPLNAYFQAKNCLIAFNTVVDSRGPGIELDAGIGTARRTLRPANITIANNVLWVKEGALLKGQEGEAFKWMGNVAWGGPAENAGEREGVRVLDPKLERGKDGLWRPAGQSPLRARAEGTFEQVRIDIDGQERAGRFDIGCDQASDGKLVNRPLTAADVGPAWMERSTQP